MNQPLLQKAAIIFRLLALLLTCPVVIPAAAQAPVQVIKGIVCDKETRTPLAGANIIVQGSNPLNGTASDSAGRFRLKSSVGRVSLIISYTGYEDLKVNDILVATGKEVELTVELREKIQTTGEIFITASADKQSSVNQMASISTSTVRTDDALRYAGGFYDPSRIVNGFAGVLTANSDESNDIVIRGNSSRGLLWRLEGIEIPNPNHFGDGQGGSGGAYSAITTNVISAFDFFTGAFPSEYGNAVSGVMDLNLRKGNTDKYEVAFQTGMIGLEAAAEGPLPGGRGSSFLVNARYVNFGILSRLNLIDLGNTNYAPRSRDMVCNLSFPGRKSGSFNAFGFFGSSALGRLASRDKTSWTSDDDRWEEMENQSASVAGIKHLYVLKDEKGYIRTVAAFTGFSERYGEGFVDSSFVRNESYHHCYTYPSFRFSTFLNSRINARDIIRTGLNVSFLGADMVQWRRHSSGKTESLVEPRGFGILYQAFAQVKNRFSGKFEINSGFHTILFSVNKDLSIEPRLGIKWQFLPGKYFNAGAGLHSRIESFPVYFNRIPAAQGKYATLNEDLGLMKSFQYVAGVDMMLSKDLRFRAEVYYQQLLDVPVIDKKTSTYSSINTSEELPSSDLTNKGSGFNKGLEFTLDKSFSNKYYALITLSLFDSRYRAGNMQWYNTYYNARIAGNILAGKDFIIGRNGRNIIGVNTKTFFRGGYRYTPPDYEQSELAGRVIYITSQTYGSQLPAFIRVDAGISYRRNNPGYSWIVMADIQNVTGRKNVFRKKFSWSDNSVIVSNIYSLGAVPVLNFRIEF
jgi:hypothetical protein